MKTLLFCILFLSYVSSAYSTEEYGLYYYNLTDEEDASKVLKYLGISNKRISKNTFHDIHKASYATVINNTIFISVENPKQVASSSYSINSDGEIIIDEAIRSKFKNKGRSLASISTESVAKDFMIVTVDNENKWGFNLVFGSNNFGALNISSTIGTELIYKNTIAHRVSYELSSALYSYKIQQTNLNYKNSLNLTVLNTFTYGDISSLRAIGVAGFEQISTNQSVSGSIAKDNYLRFGAGFNIPVLETSKHKHEFLPTISLLTNLTSNSQLGSATEMGTKWKYTREYQSWSYNLSIDFTRKNFSSTQITSNWDQIIGKIGFSF